MTAVGVTSSRRRSSKGAAFAPSARPPSRVAPLARAGLLILPIVLYLAHLAFGANQAVAAQWLTAVLAVALGVALVSPLRRGVADVGPVLPLALLFAAVVGVALWTLTPFAPGGPHPIWAWAGVSPGAITVNRSATALEIIELMGLACVFAAGALHGWRRDQASATLDGLLWAGAAYCVVALVAFATGLQVLSTGRLSGGFLSANSGATVFGILTVLGLGAVLRQLKAGDGLTWAARLPAMAVPIACLALSGLCLALTASRAGAGATALASAVLILWHIAENKSGRLATAGVGLLVLVAGIALLVGGGGAAVGPTGRHRTGPVAPRRPSGRPLARLPGFAPVRLRPRLLRPDQSADHDIGQCRDPVVGPRGA